MFAPMGQQRLQGLGMPRTNEAVGASAPPPGQSMGVDGIQKFGLKRGWRGQSTPPGQTPGFNPNPNPDMAKTQEYKPYNSSSWNNGQGYTQRNPYLKGLAGVQPLDTNKYVQNIQPMIRNTPAPAPTPAAAPPVMADGNAALARINSGLTRPLNEQEVGQLKGLLPGYTGGQVSEDLYNQAMGLIRQHRPELIRG